MKRFQIAMLPVALAMLFLVGCGDDLPTMKDLNNTNIRRVHSCYKMYMNAHNYRGPKTKEELLDFLQNDNTAKVLLGRMDIDVANIEDIFISERDDEPFKIKWGVGGVADHAIVYETTGKDGKRLVAFAKPRELDEAEYDGYWTNKIKPLGPGGAANLDLEEGLSEQN